MTATTLRALVDPAYDRARAAAAPFVPSHAEVARELQSVVATVLAMPPHEARDLLRTTRPGTWDVHVLAEVKSAWRLEAAPTPYPQTRRWRDAPRG